MESLSGTGPRTRPMVPQDRPALACFRRKSGNVLCDTELLPTIVGFLGESSRVVIASTVLTTIGGIAAALLIGPAMDRTSPFRTLGVVYLLGLGFVALFGLVIGGGNTWALLGSAFLTGTCVTGGQMSVIALATVLYPPDMRSTGVGWLSASGDSAGSPDPWSSALRCMATILGRRQHLRAGTERRVRSQRHTAN